MSKIHLGIFKTRNYRRPPAATPRRPPPPAVTSKFNGYNRYIVMGVDFGVIWAADFNNGIRFYVRRPTRRPKDTRRPPSHQNSKEMTDVSLWVSILGLFGPLISIMSKDFTSAAPTADKGSPAARRHTKIFRTQQIYHYGCRFWGYLGR